MDIIIYNELNVRNNIGDTDEQSNIHNSIKDCFTI